MHIQECVAWYSLKRLWQRIQSLSESVATAFNLVGLLVSPAPTKISFTATPAAEGVKPITIVIILSTFTIPSTGHSGHQRDRLLWDSSESLLPGDEHKNNVVKQICVQRWTAMHRLPSGERTLWRPETLMGSLTGPSATRPSLDFSLAGTP